MSKAPYNTLADLDGPPAPPDDSIERPIMVIIDVDDHIKWKELKANIKAAVDLTPGASFSSIHVMGSPDPFLLTDPDKPPPFFE